METNAFSPTTSHLPTAMKVLLFTDLVDSTAWKKTLGDRAYATELRQPHDRLFRELLADYPGAREQDNAGDGFLAVFPTPGDAVAFALRYHQALATHEWGENVSKSDRKPTTRIGIHLGEVVEFDDLTMKKVAGQAVDLAARVMGLGQGGQTLLTRHAFDSARQYVRINPVNDGPLAWVAHGQYRFKGNEDDPLEIFGVGAEGSPSLAPPPDGEKAKRVQIDAADDTGSWRPAVGLEIPRRDGWILEKQIGEGGFGEVWIAKQRKTKETRVFKFCFDAERLRSFKRELTLFRLLQSEFGERKDFVRLYDVQVEKPPYFLESEYIAEGNLADWTAKKGFAHWPQEDRLRFVAEVARTVASAHSLGIIHKDLKPSNILVRMENGVPKPVVADFGIGVLTDKGILAGRDITHTGGMNTILGNESSRTGTRLYSPPESLLGKPASTGHDVYALGVFLYQMQIGDFEEPLGTGWEERIENGDRETLLKEDIRAATLTDAVRRLPTANALAERLENLDIRTAERTLEIRVAHQTKRMRLMKRALGLAAGVMILVGGMAGYAWQQRGIAKENEGMAKTNEIKANENEAKAIAARDAARHRYQLALDAFNDMVFGIQNKLDGKADMLELRKDLLVNARKGLKKLLEESEKQGSPDRTLVVSFLRLGDVELLLGNVGQAEAEYRAGHELALKLAADPKDYQAQRDLSVSYRNLGDVHLRLNQTALAFTAYGKSLAIVGNLAVDPKDTQAQRGLSISYNKLGEAYLRVNQPAEALVAFDKSLTIREKLTTDLNDALAQRDLSICYKNHGDVHLRLNQPAKALAAYHKNLAIAEKLAADPKNAEAQRDLSFSHNNLGDVHLRLDQPHEALAAYGKSMAIDEKLAADPKNALAQRDLSVTCSKLGDVYLRLNQPDAALAVHCKGFAISLKLASDPKDALAQRDLHVICNKIGDVYLRLNQPDAALAAYKKGLTITEKLASDPNDATAQRDLIANYNRIGDAHLQLNQPVEALPAFSKTLVIAEKLAVDPNDAQAQRDLSICYSKLGEVGLRLNQPAESLALYLKSISIREKLAADPQDAQTRYDLFLSYESVGEVQLRLNQPTEALASYSKMHAIIEKLAADPKDALAQRYLCSSYDKIGNVHLRLNQPAEALDAYGKSLAIREKLAVDPKDAQAQRDLGVSYNKLGDAYLRLNQPAEALTAYGKSLATFEKLAVDPKEGQAQRDLAVAFQKVGDVHRDLKQYSKAIEWYRKLLGLSKKYDDKLNLNLDYTREQIAFCEVELRKTAMEELPMPNKAN